MPRVIRESLLKLEPSPERRLVEPRPRRRAGPRSR
jgi:hypothetical protein